MDGEADARLRGFVHAIVVGAGVPRPQRDDVEEEMLGHLVERVGAERAAGASEDEAIDRAIATFGEPSMVAADLGRAFHSQLWATTIGVLLAERASLGVRPTAVTALGWLVGIAAGISAIGGALTIWSGTPVRALLVGLGAILFVALAALVIQGLARGQAWAFWSAVVIAVELLVSGIAHSAGAPPGTTEIPLGTIGAGIVLLSLPASDEGVRRFFAGSRTIGRRLAAAIGGAFLVSLVATLVGLILPDPTQAIASDADMALSMECGHGPSRIPDGPLLPNQQFATIGVDVVWRKADVLPLGIAGLTGGAVGGDTGGFRILDLDGRAAAAPDGVPAWTLVPGDPVVTVADTGEVAGWFGSTSPSLELIPDTMGSFTVGIDNDRIRAGRTIHIAWTIAPGIDGDAPWPTAEVAYAHLDRFRIIGRVTCGQRTVGSARAQPAPSTQVLEPPGDLGS